MKRIQAKLHRDGLSLAGSFKIADEHNSQRLPFGHWIQVRRLPVVVCVEWFQANQGAQDDVTYLDEP